MKQLVAANQTPNGRIALPMIDTGGLYVREIIFFLGNSENLSKLWLSPNLFSIVIHYVLMGVRNCVLMYLAVYIFTYMM